MARELKPNKVGEYRDRQGGTVIDLMYDRNKRDHFAVVAGTMHRHGEYTGLEKLVYKAVKESLEMKWFAVIYVSINSNQWDRDREEVSIRFSHERYFLAARPDGYMNKCDWSVTDSRGSGSNWPTHEGEAIPDDLKIYSSSRWHADFGSVVSPETLPINRPGKHAGDNSAYLLAYSEALWTALDNVAANIGRLKTMLGKVLASPDGIALLITKGGSLQLPEPASPTPIAPALKAAKRR